MARAAGFHDGYWSVELVHHQHHHRDGGFLIPFREAAYLPKTRARARLIEHAPVILEKREGC